MEYKIWKIFKKIDEKNKFMIYKRCIAQKKKKDMISNNSMGYFIFYLIVIFNQPNITYIDIVYQCLLSKHNLYWYILPMFIIFIFLANYILNFLHG